MSHVNVSHNTLNELVNTVKGMQSDIAQLKASKMRSSYGTYGSHMTPYNDPTMVGMGGNIPVHCPLQMKPNQAMDIGGYLLEMNHIATSSISGLLDSDPVTVSTLMHLVLRRSDELIDSDIPVRAAKDILLSLGAYAVDTGKDGLHSLHIDFIEHGVGINVEYKKNTVDSIRSALNEVDREQLFNLYSMSVGGTKSASVVLLLLCNIVVLYP